MCGAHKEECSPHREFPIRCDRIARISKNYIIKGTPIPLARPRFNGHNRSAYDGQKTLKMLTCIGLQSQHYGEEIFDGILHINMRFHFDLPKSKSKKEELIRQQYHIYKPDLSNLQKWVEDLAVDCEIIKEDSLISSVFATKIYSPTNEPYSEFTITQIKYPFDSEY